MEITSKTKKRPDISIGRPAEINRKAGYPLGTVPHLAAEVTRHNRNTDVGPKKVEFASIGIPYYVLFLLTDKSISKGKTAKIPLSKFGRSKTARTGLLITAGGRALSFLWLGLVWSMIFFHHLPRLESFVTMQLGTRTIQVEKLQLKKKAYNGTVESQKAKAESQKAKAESQKAKNKGKSYKQRMREVGEEVNSSSDSSISPRKHSPGTSARLSSNNG